MINEAKADPELTLGDIGAETWGKIPENKEPSKSSLEMDGTSLGPIIQQLDMGLTFHSSAYLNGDMPMCTLLALTVALPVDARAQLILAGNFLIYLFFLSASAQDVQRAYERLEKFHGSLLRIAGFESEQSKLLFRPITLRIDSFFNHAAQITRRGEVINASALGCMVDVST